MFSKISLTLFLIAISLLVLVSDVQATSFVSAPGISRRDHTVLKRFIKKRAPPSTNDQGQSTPDNSIVDGLIGAGSNPPDGGDNTTNNTTTTTTTSSSSTTTETTATTSNSTTTSATDSLTTGTTTNTTTSTTSTTQTSSSPTSKTSQASQTTPPPQDNQSIVTQTETSTLTSSSSPANPTGQNETSTGGLSQPGKTTLITVLIVVGASVGAVAILWTVFRKWKLSSSKKFDQRLQPIDWQPTTDDDFAPHRHPGSDSASIHSGTESRHGLNSNLSQGLDHDFTAGPSHLAPVGGYADLSRGPSPQPYMQEALSRGPSLTRPNYDASVPLHHQNNYGVQDAYGRY